MESLDLKTIIDGGSTGIAIVLIIVLYLVIKMYNKTINNHLAHLTSAIDNNTEMMGANKEVMKRTGELIERIQRRLDQ